MITPSGVTRANVRVPTRGMSAIVRLDDLAPSRLPAVRLDGVAAARNATETLTTKANRKAGCRLEFLFILCMKLSDKNVVLAGKLQS